jgi:hypothetical protein
MVMKYFLKSLSLHHSHHISPSLSEIVTTTTTHSNDEDNNYHNCDDKNNSNNINNSNNNTTNINNNNNNNTHKHKPAAVSSSNDVRGLSGPHVMHDSSSLVVSFSVMGTRIVLNTSRA